MAILNEQAMFRLQTGPLLERRSQLFLSSRVWVYLRFVSLRFQIFCDVAR